jgi:hypothetical protein
MTTSAPVGPATDLIPLSEQFDNHDEYRPETTAELVGRKLSLHFGGDLIIEVTFETADKLSWSSSADIDGENGGAETYEAVQLRAGVLLVVIARLNSGISLLAIADLNDNRVLLNLTRLLPWGDAPEEETRYIQAGIDGPLGTAFEPTTELVGKRVHHRYSSTHAFEHIYLNAHTYAYQGLEGPEKGVADVDLTDAFKLADDLYLFSWHERAQPFNGAVAIDLANNRAYGRLFGWDRHGGKALQVRTGSVATLLNETTYDGL